MLKKSLSQNLIRDHGFLERLVDGTGLAPTDAVIEIGAGRGDLTAVLCERALKVFAIEIDRQFLADLSALEGRWDNLTVVWGDVLAIDLGSIAGGGRAKVFGNIPYGITGPILFKILGARAAFDAAYLTVQREVAERLASPPGQKSYGALSAIFQIAAEVKILRYLRPGLFVPPPRVESAFVAALFRKGWEEPEGLFPFIRSCFQHKRKVLRPLLVGAYGSDLVDRAWRSLGLGPKARAEELPPGLFIELFGLLGEV